MKQSKFISRIIALIVCAGFLFCLNAFLPVAETTAAYAHGLRETEQREQTYIHQDASTSPYLLRNTNHVRSAGPALFYGSLLSGHCNVVAGSAAIISRSIFVSASPYYALRFMAKLLYPKHWFW